MAVEHGDTVAGDWPIHSDPWPYLKRVPHAETPLEVGRNKTKPTRDGKRRFNYSSSAIVVPCRKPSQVEVGWIFSLCLLDETAEYQTYCFSHFFPALSHTLLEGLSRNPVWPSTIVCLPWFWLICSLGFRCRGVDFRPRRGWPIRAAPQYPAGLVLVAALGSQGWRCYQSFPSGCSVLRIPHNLRKFWSAREQRMPTRTHADGILVSGFGQQLHKIINGSQLRFHFLRFCWEIWCLK